MWLILAPLQTKFTTEASQEDGHVGDDYFLNSGDKIRFFLEEDAVDRDGSLNRPKEEAVNKIGHGGSSHPFLFCLVDLRSP